MSSKVILEQIDSCTMRVLAEDGILQELSDRFTFFAKDYQFNPRYKTRTKDGKRKKRTWDGKIRLLDKRSKRLYLGLWPRIQEYCNKKNYELFFEGNFGGDEFSELECKKFLQSLHLPKSIELRDYQIKALIRCIRGKRRLCLSPTGSGKSFIAYLLARHYGKTLIIVPRTNLVDQYADEFHNEYGSDPNEFPIHKIYAGLDQNPALGNVTISTWQSIVNNPRSWFDNYNAIIVDEVHEADAKSLKAIMRKTDSIDYKFGFTGTLKETELKVHRLTLEGMFGPVIHTEKTKTLQDRGFLSPLKVKCLILGYDKDDRREVFGKEYHDEIEWIVQNSSRREFEKNLALSLKGNSIFLCKLLDKHAIPLYNLIRDEATCPVYYVAGKTDIEEREAIRKIIEEHETSITVASIGVFGQGTNIKRINNIVSCAPYKSLVKVLQPIGRGLRVAEGKTHCTWIDIVDDLTWRRRKNFAVKHYEQRVKIYQDQGWTPKVYKFNLRKK